MKKIRKLLNSIYLRISGCDGMCDHCPFDLKVRCYERKNKL